MLYKISRMRNAALALAGCLVLSACAGSGEEVKVVSEADAMTYPEMAREMSDGSVQVFGLDDPVAPGDVTAIVMSPPAAMGDGGVASTVDANVTVYPFDDMREGVPAMAPVGIMPISPRVMPSTSGMLRDLPPPLPGSYEPATPIAPPPPSYPDTSRVYFGHGSSRIGAEGRAVINHAAGKGGMVVVSGHASERAETADPVERSIVNLKMSMDRAFKVSSSLIRSGVPAAYIETRAYGDARPAYDPAGGNAEAASRRVEIETQRGGSPAQGTIPPLARY